MSQEKQFTISIGKALDRIKKRNERTIKAATTQIFSSIISGTPVGNPALWKGVAPADYRPGGLRGAWQFSVNSPSPITETSVDVSGAQTISDMAAGVSAAEGSVFYLTNNKPYAARVEDGWSTQAPAGMVKVAIAQAESILEQQARRK